MADNDTMISSPDFIPSEVTTLTDANNVYNSTVSVTPRQAKGGVFAPADIKLIKDALAKYVCFDISDAEQRQVANLLHRLNNRV